MEFRPLTLADRPLYEQRLWAACVRGVDCAFGNLAVWGEQEVAEVDGQLIVFSRYGAHACYHYPLGEGDRKAALDAIIADAAERGIPCRITELYNEQGEPIESAPHPLMIFYARLPFAVAEGDILRAGDAD